MSEKRKIRLPLNPKNIDDEAVEPTNSQDRSANNEPFTDNSSDNFPNSDNPFEIDPNVFGDFQGSGIESKDFMGNEFDKTEPTETINEDEDEYEDEADVKDVYLGSVELEIDPNMTYFFIFGDFNAGKSAMLSGVLYHMQTANIGKLKSLSSNKSEHQRRGDYILDQMTNRVGNGEFITGTRGLHQNDSLPSEINLEFQPHNGESMPFCILEMAGEDLGTIELTRGGSAGGVLDARIDAYLHHPDCNMIFICVVDVDQPKKSQKLISTFIRYIDKIGRKEEPILITINKWDKVAHEYADARDYIKKNLPIVVNLLVDDSRPMSYTSFSIGDVQTKNRSGKNKDTFTFNSTDSKKVLEWMYSTATGRELGKKSKPSLFSSMFNSLKNMFSNE